MANEHPDRAQLERFLGDDLPPDERRAVVRHLLSGCARCTDLTRQLWRETGGPDPGRGGRRAQRAPSGPADSPPRSMGASVPHPSSYRGVFERVVERGRKRERELAAEREEAPRLAARLLRAPAAKRRALAHEDPRLASVALVDLLLAQSEAAEPSERRRPGDSAQRSGPSRAAPPIELAELALAITERLDPRRCGAGVVREAVLRAWAALGDARRRDGDLGGAERALAAAEAHLRAVAAAGDAEDPAGERAQLLVLAGTLAAERGRRHAAGSLLERAVAAARAAEEPRLLARALVERGLALAAAGELEAAAAALREGTDPHAEPANAALLAAGVDRLTELAATLGQEEEAARHLARLRSLATLLGEAGGPRLRWLEGKIATAADHPSAAADAEAAFLAARAGFLALAHGRDAVLVSLDLAVLYLRDARWGELRGLAGELYPVFAARDLGREALMALLVFRRIAESETASIELVVEIARYLSGFRTARA